MALKKIKVLMISNLFPRPGNEYSGVFVKKQLYEYRKYVDIELYVPIDITPSLSLIKNKSGLINKVNELRFQLKRTLLSNLTSFNDPVKGRYVRFASIPPKSFFPFSVGIAQFLRIALVLERNNKCDVVHGRNVLLGGLAAVLLGKWLKRPTVVTAIGSDIHSIGNNPIARRTTRYVLNHADIITCVTKELKDRMVHHLGISKDKIKPITNGINLEFSKGAHIKNIRKKLEIPHGAPLFLSVANLVQVKDPFTLLMAFKKVSHKTSAHLIMVGGGVLENEVLAYLERLDLNDRVHLTGGIPHEEIPSYMNACDVFCLSSLREGWPNVLFEAMIFGKPVVATHVGGIPEAVYSEEYGLLVPPAQPDRMSGAMLEALQKKWNHRKIMDYAENNSWEIVARKYFDIYRDLPRQRFFDDS